MSKAIQGPPIIAIMSTNLEQNSKSSYQHIDLSDMLWTLWRLGIKTIVAHPRERKAMNEVLYDLSPPPQRQSDVHTILARLHDERRTRFQSNVTNHLPWTKYVQIVDIPKVPINFDEIQLCFNDELIGSPNAFLIHYGPSHYEVSGYHHPISAISVPIGDELTALVIVQLPYTHPKTQQVNIEPCVIHLSSKGNRLKGPWWPRIHKLM